MEDKKPKLRFQGFEEEWQDETLGRLGQFLGGGTPSTQNTDYWQGNNPWISSSDIIENNVRDINISRYISDEAIRESATVKCPANTIHLITRVGLGKLAFSKQELCTSQDFSNIVLKEDFDVPCITYILGELMKDMKRRAQGTTVKGVTVEEAKSYILSIPQNITEQKKIGEFFEELDELICAKEQEVEKLKQIKAALLDKMFPNDESDKPNRGV